MNLVCFMSFYLMTRNVEFDFNFRLDERGIYVEELARELKLLLDKIKPILLFLYCLAIVC